MSATASQSEEKSTMSRISEKVSDALSSAQEKVLDVMGVDKRRTIYRDASSSSAATSSSSSEPLRPTSNRAIVWSGPKQVAIKDIGYPKMQTPQGKKINHGVILKVVASGLCGSDLHLYRGSFEPCAKGTTFGHEITGEVVEMGEDVERFDVGDIVSVPFNVSCGRCDNCREMKTAACLKCNPIMPGAAFGFSTAMGSWQGGQAEYVLVPYADHMLLRLPKDKAIAKITSLAFLSDIFPTGFNGAVQAGVKAGSIVYVAGAGPVGLCCARACFLLGAAAVFISDLHEDRLNLAKGIGCHTINLKNIQGGHSDSDHIMAAIDAQLPPEKNGEHTLVDCSVDCVGYEGCGCGSQADQRISEQVLNTCFKVTKAGGGVGIPGIYPLTDPNGVDADRKAGVTHLQFGVAWNKALCLGMGQCPVINHNKDLLKTILHDRVDLTSLLNVQIISLDELPAAYERFDNGEAVKFLVDPHGMLAGRGAAAAARGPASASAAAP